MAQASTTERPDGLLWRLARLHPGLLWLLFLVFVFVGSILDGILQSLGSVLQVPVGAILLLLLFAYPLFVIAFTTRVHTSSSPRRLTRAIRAFAFVGFWGAVLALFRYFTLSTSVDVPEVVQQALAISVLPMFVAIFYLWISASVALVQAEKDGTCSLWSVFGTFLLFFYSPFFGCFFLQRRLRRLAPATA